MLGILQPTMGMMTTQAGVPTMDTTEDRMNGQGATDEFGLEMITLNGILIVPAVQAILQWFIMLSSLTRTIVVMFAWVIVHGLGRTYQMSIFPPRGADWEQRMNGEQMYTAPYPQEQITISSTFLMILKMVELVR